MRSWDALAGSMISSFGEWQLLHMAKSKLFICCHSLFLIEILIILIN